MNDPRNLPVAPKLVTPQQQPALDAPARPTPQTPSGLDRALGALRVAFPLVQRLLPLLDGNLGTAVANFIPSRQAAPVPAQPSPADLELIVDALTVFQQDLAAQQTEQRGVAGEQAAVLQRIEARIEAHIAERVEEQMEARIAARLELLHQAADRNAQTQQEQMTELQAALQAELQAGRKSARVFARITLLALGISIAANVFIFLFLRRLIP